MNLRLTDTKIVNDINYAGIKVCKNCDVEYPATEKYFYRAKGNRDGLRCECKRCFDNTHNQKKLKDLKTLDNVKVAEEKDKKIKEVESQNRLFVDSFLYEKEEKEKLKNRVGGLVTALATALILSTFIIVSILCYK